MESGDANILNSNYTILTVPNINSSTRQRAFETSQICDLRVPKIGSISRHFAHGAQDRFYKINTLSQKALKRRIYAVCTGRSDGT